MNTVEGKLTYGYTFRNKLEGEFKKKNLPPGPGNYDAVELNKTKKKNPSSVFGTEGKDLNKNKVKFPGPGAYTPDSDKVLQDAPKFGYHNIQV